MSDHKPLLSRPILRMALVAAIVYLGVRVAMMDGR